MNSGALFGLSVLMNFIASGIVRSFTSGRGSVG
jgi:hypothetical protein